MNSTSSTTTTVIPSMRKVEVGGVHDRSRLAAGDAQVVAVEGDVQVAEVDGAAVAVSLSS